MNNCMTFPDTVEEFMELYKVVDTEQIYSNGMEFVPIFRMKQWFEHMPSTEPSVRCKDCKYYEDGWIHCNRVTWWNGRDDYCSRAERRTE